MKLINIKIAFLAAGFVSLSACGFHLRNEAQMPTGIQRINVEVADTSSSLKRDVEAALRRSGVQVEATTAPGIAELKILVNTLTPEVQAVGATARVRQFVMLYHVEVEVDDSEGKVLVPRQTIELSREFTFDETQALGTAAVQDDLKKQMGRDMVQAIMRRLEAAGRTSLR